MREILFRGKGNHRTDRNAEMIRPEVNENV